MSARVRLVGAFREFSGKKQVKVSLGEGETIQDIIKGLVESLPPEFGEALVDPILGEPLPTALILVNGREISVLDGGETLVRDGDEVVFVPVTHGG